ncbi:MAG: 23S rRNA (guanosine(2251)-2'-O)-methyltransferase RlmB, partial [Chloroflexi bacterium]|nr:23S rRNA (guanosine(2251)-2'-O)-methyltransferase RlmB [Chloroflexota bacterium]
MSDVIEGREPVIEALKSGRPINKILLSRTVGRHSTIAQIMYLARERGILVEFVEKSIIDLAAVTPVNQGVIAYAAMKEYVTLDDLLIISREKNEKPLYCILDGIEDPHNLGAILRTADATGVHGVVIRERRAVGLTASVAKASAGAVEYVPVARVTNIAQSIESLKKNNVWVIGLDQGSKTEFTKIDFTMPTAIVIGGEGAGLSDVAKKRCDSVVSIP